MALDAGVGDDDLRAQRRRRARRRSGPPFVHRVDMPDVDLLLVVAAAWLLLDLLILGAVAYWKRRERDLSRTTR